ncbi:DNA-directed RNA polymerase subunit omega [Peptococcaceae bacterium 1198_IL3148]
MNRIPLDELLEKVDSRYSLVIAAAKRARQLIDMELQEGNREIQYKVVSHALKEISNEDVKVVLRNRDMPSTYELK